MLINVLTIINIGILVYYMLLSIWYTVLLVLSFPEVIKKFREIQYGNANRLINEHSLIPITIVTAVFNEGEEMLNMIFSVLISEYKNIKLILVNDGSTDNTMEMLKKELLLFEIPIVIQQIIKTERIKAYYQSKRFKNIMVIDKEHSPYNCGADCLNAGLNACKTPIILSIDADTIIEPEAISRMMFTILSTPHCVMVSGSIYVLNENLIDDGKMFTTKLPQQFLTSVQAIEYLRSFLYGRAGLNALGGAMCYPSAFTLFETEALREINGYDKQNFSYDSDITLKMHHYMARNKFPHNMNHSPNAFSWTDVPNTYKSYWRQRNFWQRGMLRSFQSHAGMLFNPRYGKVGIVTFPTYVIFEIFGSVIEFTSLIMVIIFYAFGIINLTSLIWFLLLSLGFIAFISVAMFFLNQISFNKYNQPSDILRVLFLVIAEMFGFRQFRAFCCTIATFQYVINRLKGKPL
ncbi:MAG: glycosyltransferase family 2 protein [Tatlockia sp.]|nr:glycosyltransferase family 2 protein [Tatlockia sp.]